MYYRRRTKAVHLAYNYNKLFENWITEIEWLISTARFTDSCGRVLTNYWFSSAHCQFIDYRQQQQQQQQQLQAVDRNDSKTQVGEQRFLDGSRGLDWKGSRAGCGPRAASWTTLA